MSNTGQPLFQKRPAEAGPARLDELSNNVPVCRRVPHVAGSAALELFDAHGVRARVPACQDDVPSHVRRTYANPAANSLRRSKTFAIAEVSCSQ